MRNFENLSEFHKTQYNAILDENKAKDTRLKPIRDHLSKNYIIEEIVEINDYQIAKVKNKNSGLEWLYPTFINYKPLHEMGMTFDHAVLICLSYKYDNNRSDAVPYLSRVLNANFSPEFTQIQVDFG